MIINLYGILLAVLGKYWLYLATPGCVNTCFFGGYTTSKNTWNPQEASHVLVGTNLFSWLRGQFAWRGIFPAMFDIDWYTWQLWSSLLYIHTYIHTYIRTYVRTYVHTYIHTYIHTITSTYLTSKLAPGPLKIHWYWYGWTCSEVMTLLPLTSKPSMEDVCITSLPKPSLILGLHVRCFLEWPV